MDTLEIQIEDDVANNYRQLRTERGWSWEQTAAYVEGSDARLAAWMRQQPEDEDGGKRTPPRGRGSGSKRTGEQPEPSTTTDGGQGGGAVPAPEAPAQPTKSAPKAEWEAFAAASIVAQAEEGYADEAELETAQRVAAAAVAEFTKDQLIDKFSG